MVNAPIPVVPWEFRSWRGMLSDPEVETVEACLVAAADGPFFPDWEFHTLFGFEREEIRKIASAWPTAADERTEFLAINAAMNNLLGYPHGMDRSWSEWVPVDRDALRHLFTRIREAAGANDHTRALLQVEMGRLVGLTDAELVAREKQVGQVVAIASRLGCDVPDRLQAAVEAASGRPTEAP